MIWCSYSEAWLVTEKNTCFNQCDMVEAFTTNEKVLIDLKDFDKGYIFIFCKAVQELGNFVNIQKQLGASLAYV